MVIETTDVFEPNKRKTEEGWDRDILRIDGYQRGLIKGVPSERFGFFLGDTAFTVMYVLCHCYLFTPRVLVAEIVMKITLCYICCFV